MKASKFFKLKAEWQRAKQEEQPDIETITPVVQEVKQEEQSSTLRTTKKKTTNV